MSERKTCPQRREMRRPRLAAGLTFGALLFICTLNYWIFREFFGLSYLLWYSNAGPFIALATAAFGAAWGGIDKNPALVSANPLTYVGACFQVANERVRRAPAVQVPRALDRS